MNTGDFKKAQQNYEYCLENEEHSPEVYCCLGASFEKQEQFEKAIHWYKEAIKLNAEWDDGYFGVGVCLFAKTRFFEALHFLKKALKLDDKNAVYWLAVADAEAQLGNTLSATEAYQQSVALDPNHSDAWIKWSTMLYEQAEYDEAADVMLSGIDEMPEDAELHYRACIYLIHAGKYRDAFLYLETALILNYDRHTILYNYFTNIETQKALFRVIEQYRK